MNGSKTRDGQNFRNELELWKYQSNLVSRQISLDDRVFEICQSCSIF